MFNQKTGLNKDWAVKFVLTVHFAVDMAVLFITINLNADSNSRSQDAAVPVDESSVLNFCATPLTSSSTIFIIKDEMNNLSSYFMFKKRKFHEKSETKLIL